MLDPHLTCVLSTYHKEFNLCIKVYIYINIFEKFSTALSNISKKNRMREYI